MFLGLVVVLLLVGLVFVAAIGCSVGGAIWAYRRVVADYPAGTAVFASLAFGGLLFVGGWMVFAPAWLAGWLRRRWGGKRMRSGRFVLGLLSLIGIAIMALGVAGVLQTLTEARRAEALRTHGVRAEGHVLSASYDADGGDPGGWTSIRARFTDRRGRTHTVTIGHHDKATERPGEAIVIVYDPSDPEVAEMASYPQYDRLDANVGLVFGGVSVSVGAAMTILFLCLARRRRPTPPAGWYADPHQMTTWRFWDGKAWTG